MIKEILQKEPGPEMTRLLERLFSIDRPEDHIKNFSKSPGPKWNSLTEEERAKTINDMLDSPMEVIDNFDD